MELLTHPFLILLVIGFSACKCTTSETVSEKQKLIILPGSNKLGTSNPGHNQDVDWKSIHTLLLNMDAKINIIQEKAHVWEIFRHHINAWTEHIASVDRKLELLKLERTAESQYETKLNNIEFSVKAILSVVDSFKDLLRTHLTSESSVKEINPIVREDLMQKVTEESELRDDVVVNKLTAIQKLIHNVQTDCRKLGTTKGRNNMQLKSFSVNQKDKKLLKNTEDIMEAVKELDDKLRDLDDNNRNEFESLRSICTSTQHELIGFTNSSDTLLKRIEYLVRILNDKFERNSQCEKNPTNTEPTTTEETNFHRPKSCSEIEPTNPNNVYAFYDVVPDNDERNIHLRYCYKYFEGEPHWTMIMERNYKFLKRESFNRTWDEYKYGFGKIMETDFWFGNDLIHQLTSKGSYELLIVLEDWEDRIAIARYNYFGLGNESDSYRLKISGYDGDAGDSLSEHHNSIPFSTYDRNNDPKGQSEAIDCASHFGSGWWFSGCGTSNLNGEYKVDPLGNDFNGIMWESWLGDYSLKNVKMLIKEAVTNSEESLEDP